MTTNDHVLMMILMGAAIVAVLTIGTLAAAGLIGRDR
jgi:hypothetical protein